mmetsp:Transcript_21872/g.62236  ORF Transcript_21872/g.62236 Transcript_21872/m.62236 type:complete len:406 (+) Transcript_21872:71-1288(+)
MVDTDEDNRSSGQLAHPILHIKSEFSELTAWIRCSVLLSVIIHVASVVIVIATAASYYRLRPHWCYLTLALEFAGFWLSGVLYATHGEWHKAILAIVGFHIFPEAVESWRLGKFTKTTREFETVHAIVALIPTSAFYIYVTLHKSQFTDQNIGMNIGSALACCIYLAFLLLLNESFDDTAEDSGATSEQHDSLLSGQRHYADIDTRELDTEKGSTAHKDSPSHHDQTSQATRGAPSSVRGGEEEVADVSFVEARDLQRDQTDKLLVTTGVRSSDSRSTIAVLCRVVPKLTEVGPWLELLLGLSYYFFDVHLRMWAIALAFRDLVTIGAFAAVHTFYLVLLLVGPGFRDNPAVVNVLLVVLVSLVGCFPLLYHRHRHVSLSISVCLVVLLIRVVENTVYVSQVFVD